MKNFLKKPLIFAMGVFLCLPVGNVYASENNIQEYKNGDISGYTSVDSDSETIAKIDKLMKEKMNQELSNVEKDHVDENKPLTRAPIFYNHTSSDDHMGKDSRNTNARSYTHAKAVWGKALTYPQIDTAGYSKGTYEGPSTPSKIVLNQSYYIAGLQLNVSVALPPGASISKDNSSGSWQSQTVSNVKAVTASYPTMRIRTLVGITSVTFTDTADIYFGGTIYRPTSRVKLT